MNKIFKKWLILCHVTVPSIKTTFPADAGTAGSGATVWGPRTRVAGLGRGSLRRADFQHERKPLRRLPSRPTAENSRIFTGYIEIFVFSLGWGSIAGRHFHVPHWSPGQLKKGGDWKPALPFLADRPCPADKEGFRGGGRLPNGAGRTRFRPQFCPN